MIIVNLPNGKTLEFQDGTPREKIQESVLYAKNAYETGAVEAASIKLGEGLVKLGRALGIADMPDESERKSSQAMDEAHPVASFVGDTAAQSVPFVLAGGIPGLVGRAASTRAAGAVASKFGNSEMFVNAAKTLASRGGRAGLNVAAGAAQGVLNEKGDGSSAADQLAGGVLGGVTAGAMELVAPYIGAIADKVFKRITGRVPAGTLLTTEGLPTPEFSEALGKAGISFDDLDNAVIGQIDSLPPGANPEQAARLARYKEIDPNFPATRGDITKQYADMGNEALALDSVADPSGAPLRDLRVNQSRILQDKIKGVAGGSGNADGAGESIQAALRSREEGLKTAEHNLYAKSLKNRSDLSSVPIPLDVIKDALPPSEKMRRVMIHTPREVEALKALLSEFQVRQSDIGDAAVKAKKLGFKNLDISNFQTFREALNGLLKGPRAEHMGELVIPIKKALDESVDSLIADVERQGYSDATGKIIRPLKKAREISLNRHNEFSRNSIAGILTDLKPDRYTNVTEASKVYQKIASAGQPVEYVERTVDSLSKSGIKGRVAMGNLQAATVMDILGAAMKSESRTINGIKTISPIGYIKKFDEIGERRLKAIFKSNPKGYRDLSKIRAVMNDLKVDGGAIPKGSARVNFDTLLMVLRNIPGLGPFASRVAGGISTLSKMGGNREAVAKALQAQPEIKRVYGMLETNAPAVLSAMGISGITGGDNGASD